MLSFVEASLRISTAEHFNKVQFVSFIISFAECKLNFYFILCSNYIFHGDISARWRGLPHLCSAAVLRAVTVRCPTSDACRQCGLGNIGVSNLAPLAVFCRIWVMKNEEMLLVAFFDGFPYSFCFCFQIIVKLKGSGKDHQGMAL